MHQDERKLVAKSKAGNLDAFEELIKRYEKKIYTAVYRFIGNQHDACDLLQETFIRAYQALPELREEASFPTWIYRIAANVCRDELRRRRKHNNISLDEELISPGNPQQRENCPQEHLEQTELRDRIQECLNTLPDEYRLILILRELHGLSYEEIASTLDCSLGTVKSRLSRARCIFKRRFSETLTSLR